MDEKCDSAYLSDRNQHYIDIAPMAMDGVHYDAEHQGLATAGKSTDQSLILEPAYQNHVSSRMHTDKTLKEKSDSTSLLKHQQPLFDNTSSVPIVSKEMTSSIFMRGGGNTGDNGFAHNNVDVSNGELQMDDELDMPVNNPKSASFDDQGENSHILR